MKTDVITLSNTGTGIAEALAQTEKAAIYRGLTPKQTLRLRLLAEEMMGMLRTIVGETKSDYWVEAEGSAFSLHLSTRTRMYSEMREELLKASTTGKNAAAAGFMGRMRDILTRMYEPDKDGIEPGDYGFYYQDAGIVDGSIDPLESGMLYGWSLNEYRAAIGANRDREEEKWDELEKSITANLADEIRIYIRADSVEMVIEKKF